MWLRGAVLALMAMAVGLLTLEVGSGQDVKKDAQVKDAAKNGKDKKFEVPKDAITGTVRSVNMGKATFTITLSDKKERTFEVDKKTEFYGPKGGDRGTGPEGLKDDCMTAGHEIRVVATKDGKTAKDVYLPVRKTETKKDK